MYIETSPGDTPALRMRRLPRRLPKPSRCRANCRSTADETVGEFKLLKFSLHRWAAQWN